MGNSPPNRRGFNPLAALVVMEEIICCISFLPKNTEYDVQDVQVVKRILVGAIHNPEHITEVLETYMINKASRLYVWIEKIRLLA